MFSPHDSASDQPLVTTAVNLAHRLGIVVDGGQAQTAPEIQSPLDQEPAQSGVDTQTLSSTRDLSGTSFLRPGAGGELKKYLHSLYMPRDPA